MQFVARVISARISPLDAGGNSQRASQKLELSKQFARVIMQIVVSIVVLVMSVILLVKSEHEDVRKLASGLAGTVLGYWLR